MRTLGAIWLKIYYTIYIFESKGALGAIEKYIRLGDIGKAKKKIVFEATRNIEKHIEKGGNVRLVVKSCRGC